MRLAQPPRHNGDERIRPDDGRLRRTSRRSRCCRLSRALSHSVRPAPRQAKRLGARKLDSWHAWKDTVRTVSPLPRRMTPPLLYGLPLVEGLTASFILLSPKMGFAAAGALLCSLAVAVLALSTKHRGQSCSCFGALAPSEISPRLAGRNAMLASVAGIGAYGAGRVGAESVPVGTLSITLLVALLVSISLQFYRFSRLGPGLRDG